MNIAFALDFIPRRMKELGHGENYFTRYRHVRLEKMAKVKIKANNQLLLFISPEDTSVMVKSVRGVFNLTDFSINEQQHEHSGEVEITNNSGADFYALFIQVIPQIKIKNIKA